MAEQKQGDQHTEQELLELLGTLAMRLSDAEDLQDTLQQVVDSAQELITNCDGVSLMLISRGGKVDTPAYSSEAARNSDYAQYETGQEPCLESLRHERTVMIDDLETDERWPDYRAKALKLGVRSMMSVQLFVTNDNMGALDLYSQQPYAFDERQQAVGQVFATHASIAVKAALVEAGLNISIRSRDVIGQAKGIIMARLHMTDEMAFDTLRHISQNRNISIRELAQRIARTGEVSSADD